MEFLTALFSRAAIAPSVLWSTVVSDALIAAVFFSSPIAVIRFWHRRGDPTSPRVAGLFSAFIVACGTTYVVDIWTIWHPDYGLQALAKLLAAALSCATAVVLWELLPHALEAPTADQLQEAIASPHAETESSRLAAIVESSQDAIIGMTLDGRITYWNQGAQAMFGYAAEEAVGQPVQMLIPREREAEEMRSLAELARGRRVPPFDTVRLAKGGEHIDVSLTISPIRNARGSIVGGAKIARNVGEQQRAEAALRESQLRLRFILDAAQIGEWESDLVTGVVTRSLQHDRCFGYDMMAPTWDPDTYMAHVHRDDRPEISRITQIIRNSTADWNYECRVVWPDHSIHWIRVNGSTIFEGSKAIRLVGIIADITQWKLAEELRLRSLRLEAENRQMQEANRLKTRVLANMSHELRTPLNAIIGFSDLLYLGAVPRDSPKFLEFLGHIRASGHHLLQLINDVLDLSKVEAGKLLFAPETISLPAIVKDVGDIMRSEAQKKNITVAVDIEASLPDLVLDPVRLKQVLFNYLSNAIKFTPEDGRVIVRARREGHDHFRIEVEDTGIGVSAADLPRLFSEFEQLDQGLNKRHQGTGLGLALTRRLIEAQGGQVGVSSDLGRGSVFYLVLNLIHGTDLGRSQ
jgi:PAS domain S-box-containing protein